MDSRNLRGSRKWRRWLVHRPHGRGGSFGSVGGGGAAGSIGALDLDSTGPTIFLDATSFTGHLGSKIALNNVFMSDVPYYFLAVTVSTSSGTMYGQQHLGVQRQGASVVFQSNLAGVNQALESLEYMAAGTGIATVTVPLQDPFLSESGVLTVTTACFLEGTRILSARGEVRVEELAEGDGVITAGGATRPIVWIGRQSVAVATQ